MVAHILAPEVADKLQQCFLNLTSGMQNEDMPRLVSGEDDERATGHVVDWGRLQSLIDELGGEKGLTTLIEHLDLSLYGLFMG